MPAPQFSVNTYRYAPYKNFKFRVKWDNKYVAGVNQVSALSRSTEVVRFRYGGDPSTPRPSPGQTDYHPITLRQGVTYDVAFEQWANKVWDYQNSTKSPSQATQIVSLADFRKDVIIELYNEAGQKVIAYNVYNCWISEYTALSELDSLGNEFAFQTITLQHEGWQRDTSVKETAQPSFTLPAS